LLPVEAVSLNPSLNFLTEPVAAYVEQRVPIVLAESGALDEDRLRRNLLSSMPMCFNLFGMLRAHPVCAARLLSHVTGLEIMEIEQIEVEWTPVGPHPLGDRTAFDGWLSYRRPDGQRGFFGVETKYTEPFSRRFYDCRRYREVTQWASSGFMEGAAVRLRQIDTNQLWRNTLLALAIRQDADYAEGRVLVVSLADDPHVEQAMALFETVHECPDSLVLAVSFEQIIECARPEPVLASWASLFHRRYLDLSPVR
jgi:hypothetical protein